jgi:RNA polymerase sigma-70 factor (ECF subfamily)
MKHRAFSDDPAIVTRAKAGDAEAWRQLYEHVGGRLVVWLTAQPHLDAALDADDIAHDAWVTAAGKIADFSGGVDDFTGWLFGIARNLTLNANRRTIRRANSSLDQDVLLVERRHAGDSPTPLAVQLDWTRRLLSRLPAREAQVVACIDVVGLDVASTSASLEISATAVRVAHHRAVRRLRTLVDELDLDHDGLVAESTRPLRVGSWT